MRLTIDLSPAEVESLDQRRKSESESLEHVIHRLLAPIVSKDSEARLSVLADQYRALTPDLQAEVVQMLRGWLASKTTPAAPAAEVTPGA
jgi:hypothetical protein